MPWGSHTVSQDIRCFWAPFCCSYPGACLSCPSHNRDRVDVESILYYYTSPAQCFFKFRMTHLSSYAVIPSAKKLRQTVVTRALLQVASDRRAGCQIVALRLPDSCRRRARPSAPSPLCPPRTPARASPSSSRDSTPTANLTANLTLAAPLCPTRFSSLTHARGGLTSRPG